MKTNGARIRELRKARGWLQRDLAERTQIGHTYLSTIENGRVEPSRRAIARIARMLGVKVSELYTSEDA